MRTFTAITPTKLALPPALSLLLAPVYADEPSAPGEYVGHADGVLLDEQGRVVAFVVRLSSRLVAGSPRTLVAASAVTATAASTLHLSWTEDQLLAQPRLDENLKPHNRLDGGAPVESQWMPARPNVVPPGPGVNGKEALKEGLEGVAAGAAFGAVAGLAIGGPIGALALAGFCAAGGALAGVLSGATHESAIEASEMKFDNIAPEHAAAHGSALRLLEEQLRDPGLPTSGFVDMSVFAPLTTTEPPTRPVPSPPLPTSPDL